MRAESWSVEAKHSPTNRDLGSALKPQEACARYLGTETYCCAKNCSHCNRLKRSLATFERCCLPPALSQALKPSNARSFCPQAIRLAVACPTANLPSAVRGPVLMPPWFLHLPLVSALAWQGLPVLLACASHLTLFFMLYGQFELLAIPLIQLRVSSSKSNQQMAYL
jgi:hypothetical protein